MGMLTLAGAASGGGKALQRGLENTQQYMSNSLLLEERDKNERERMKLTFGHDEGMLQKRAAIDRDLMVEREGIQQRNAKEMKGIDQSDALKRLEVGHGYDKETASNRATADKELEDVRQKNRINELVVQHGYTQQEAARKAAEERAEKARDRKADSEKVEKGIGRDIVVETLRNQRPHADGSASGKLDPNVNATLKVYDQELKDLGDELNNVMTKPDRAAAIQKRMEVIRNEQFKLLGRSRGEDKPARKPIIFPE